MNKQISDTVIDAARPIDYQRLLNSVDEPLVAVDLRRRVIAFNRAAEEITGYRASEVLDHPCADLFPGKRCTPICCAAPESESEDQRFQVELRRRMGAPLPVTVTTAPLHDAAGQVVGTLETIHLRDNGQFDRVLQQETSHKLAILDSLAEGVITVDREWRISSFNAAAERMLGYESADVLGKFCSRVLRSELCSNGCPLVRTLEEGVPLQDRMLSMTRADDSPLEVSMNTSVLRSDSGEPLGGVLSFRPVPTVHQLPAREDRAGGFLGFVGTSAPMRRVYRLIEEVAASDATVLVTGESGTGKELVAAALHQLSRRHEAPFIKVNCAVFSESLLESELFGHVRGAFTDARSDRRGRFELAAGGTFFLDEIGDVSPRIQVKLLRVLQEREFERVGGEETVRVDVRLVAATHQDLQALVEGARFREDLFYRLNVIPIHLPALRERREDIPQLVHHFVQTYARRAGKDVSGVDERTLDVLLAHPWPGNVRQLENAIEHAIVRARGSVLTEDLLPADVRAPGARPATPAELSDEAQQITAALERHHWHHEHAAHELGISRTTLWRRMRKLGLQPRK